MGIEIYRSWGKIGREMGRDYRTVKGKVEVIPVYIEKKDGSIKEVGKILERDVMRYFVEKRQKQMEKKSDIPTKNVDVPPSKP